MKTIKGRIIGFSLGASGKREDGNTWQIYKYNVFADNKEKVMTGFINPADYLKKFVAIDYEQTPNDKGGFYNNVKNIREEVTTEEVEEANKQYGVVGVAPTSPDWDGIRDRKDNSILFGMAINNTMNWLMNERRIEQTPSVTFDTHFDKMFEHIYKVFLDKRKEKLGY